MPRNPKLSAPQVMRFPAHVSPVDGSFIETREQRREHNKRNRCIDVGRESTKRERPKIDVKKTLRREYEKRA